MAAFEIEGLHRAVQESVPKAEFDRLSKENQGLAEKYRVAIETDVENIQKAQLNLQNDVYNLVRYVFKRYGFFHNVACIIPCSVKLSLNPMF